MHELHASAQLCFDVTHDAWLSWNRVSLYSHTKMGSSHLLRPGYTPHVPMPCSKWRLLLVNVPRNTSRLLLPYR